MNIALMFKWVWRIFTENPADCLWLRIIRAKYPGAVDVFNSTPQGGSPFWHDIHKIKNFFKLGVRFKLGSLLPHPVLDGLVDWGGRPQFPLPSFV
jgi:hypothetical protein